MINIHDNITRKEAEEYERDVRNCFLEAGFSLPLDNSNDIDRNKYPKEESRIIERDFDENNWHNNFPKIEDSTDKMNNDK